MSPTLQQFIEGLALQKPRRRRRIADGLGRGAAGRSGSKLPSRLSLN